MKKIFARFLIIAFLFTLASSSFASQNSVVLSTTSPYAGINMLHDANNAFNTLISNNSGATAPTVCYNNQFWVDTTNNILKFTPNCTNWYPIGGFGAGYWDAYSDGTTLNATTSTGSANAYVVTYAPAPTALVIGRHYPFIANFQNTTAATENVNGLGAHAITKNGAVALVSNDIPNGIVVDDVWDGTEFQMTGQIGNSSNGTVTSVGTSGAVCGGTFTTSGTISLCSQTGPYVLGSATTAVPGVLSMTSLTALLNNFTSSLAGLVPASGGGTANFLRADGAFAPPPGGLTLITTVTCTSGCSGGVVFNNTKITSTYNFYTIKFYSAYFTTPANSSGAFCIDGSTNNGSTFLSNWSFNSGVIGTSAQYDTRSGQSHIYPESLSGFDNGNATATEAGTINLYAPTVSGPVAMSWDYFSQNFQTGGGSGAGTVLGGAHSATNAAINYVKIFDCSGNGNNTYGVWELYGYQ